MVTALVGSTGLIGRSLKQHIHVDNTFNSSNLKQAINQTFDVVYCCAPSGNRILANQRPDADLENIKNIISVLSTVKTQRFVLISTVDTQHDPTSPYGSNRLFLENFVKTLDNYSIVRLCSLVDNTINKNMLFDLKYRKFLESINLNQIVQWYKLSDLPKHLKIITQNNIKEINLVSEPVQNQEIVDKFFPELKLNNRVDSRPYNLHSISGLFGTNSNYVYTKSQVFNFIKEYLND